jgi:antitoxin CptB
LAARAGSVKACGGISKTSEGDGMSGEDLDVRRRRAAYRASHRGTKEMDWLLGRYANAVLPELEGEDLEQFERLLMLPDPDLQKWLMHPELSAGTGFTDLIHDMRRFHRLE